MKFLWRFYPSIGDDPDPRVVLRLRQAVLLLMLLMVAVTPLLQIHSLDQFPVATDDIETQAIYCVLTIGMLLVTALVLTIVPVLIFSRLPVPPSPKMTWNFPGVGSHARDESPPPGGAVPLRI